MTIDRFQGEYRWLSNFQAVDVVFDGETYPSTEAAYQAAKTMNIDDRRIIRDAPTPGKAKKIGMTVTLRPDWEVVKVAVMTDLVRQKFTNNPELRAKLLATGDQELIEGNDWSDRFWGVCDGVGENWLGKITMMIRAELYYGPG